MFGGVKVEAAKALLESQDRMKREHKSAMAEQEKSFKEREEVVRREMVSSKVPYQDLMILARRSVTWSTQCRPMRERMIQSHHLRLELRMKVTFFFYFFLRKSPNSN